MIGLYMPVAIATTEARIIVMMKTSNPVDVTSVHTFLRSPPSGGTGTRAERLTEMTDITKTHFCCRSVRKTVPSERSLLRWKFSTTTPTKRFMMTKAERKIQPIQKRMTNP